MKKKAQLTLFIIIGVVIVVAILGIVLITNLENSETKTNSPEILEVVNYIEGCLEDTSKQGIVEVSRKGGYYPKSTDTTILDIPYYVKDGVNLMPSKEEYSKAISNYIGDKIQECLNDYKSLGDFKITNGEREIETVIENDSTTIFYTTNEVVETAGKKYEMAEFKLTQPSKLGTLYEEAEYLVSSQMILPGSICLSCVLEISTSENLDVITNELDDGTVIYAITDNKELINNEPLSLLFAFKSNEAPNE